MKIMKNSNKSCVMDSTIQNFDEITTDKII